jgi:hypothetical protein
VTASVPNARPDSPAIARALAVAMLLWLAATAVFWPAVGSFGDDVGYIGEARLLLGGHLRPAPGDVGIWQHGVAKYPLFPSLLFTPLFAISPRAVFAIGIGAALLICWLAARVLESWGDEPVWAALLLAHPTIVIISRTATADVPLCALMLATWWSLRNDRAAAAVFSCAALFMIKVTGGVIAAALIGGEMLRRFPALRRRERTAWAAARTAGIAVALGIAGVVATNWLTTGGAWFGYENPGVPVFWPAHFPRIAPQHMLTVLLLPPLLIVGAIPFWRRREFGPLAVIFGYGGLMCFYFFIDVGTNWIESRIIGPRLLLPVVVFLLIGYAHVLARLSRRVTARALVILPLIAIATASALAIGFEHARQQRPAAEAVAAAERIARARGVTDLGIVPEAEKSGVMFPGRVRSVNRAAPTDAVLLCSIRGASHRAPLAAGALSCDLPGYRPAWQGDGFFVLTR